MRPTRLPSTMPCLCPSPERGSTRRECDRRMDAGPEVESRRAGGGVPRELLAHARVEDLYVESLQTKSRLAPRQQLRDMLDQLARQHDLGRERQPVHAVLVEKRERIGVLAESLLREVCGEKRNSLFLPFSLRIGLQVFGLCSETDAERSLRKRRDLAEDVGVQRKFELEVAVAALDLVRLRIDG